MRFYSRPKLFGTRSFSHGSLSSVPDAISLNFASSKDEGGVNYSSLGLLKFFQTFSGSFSGSWTRQYSCSVK